MNYRIKLLVDSLIMNSRVHAQGDVIEVDEDQYKRLVKVEKVASESDEDLTEFPAPAEPEQATADIPPSPDGGLGGVETGGGRRGNRR